MCVDKGLWKKEKTLVWRSSCKSWKRRKSPKKQKGRLEAKQNCDDFDYWPVLYSLFSPNTCIKLPSQALWISDSRRMAMGRGVRVFHAPGQSPYSVLVEQRGVDQLLLLESQVKYLDELMRISNWICLYFRPSSRFLLLRLSLWRKPM